MFIKRNFRTSLCSELLFYFSVGSLRLPSFSHFPLHVSLNSFFEGKNIHTPTYIQYALLASLNNQQSTIRHITSPTGSGKTLAYLLPIVNAIKQQEEKIGILTASRRPRALVLTANKELVLQCRNVGKQIAHHSKFKIEGINIGRTMVEERKTIENGVDILVSTYLRLTPLLDKGELFLTNLKWIVVDEIDTLYEMGRLSAIVERLLMRFGEEGSVRMILSGTTCSKELRGYLKSKLGELIEIVDKNTHFNLQNIRHEFIHCGSLDKHEPLMQLLQQRRTAKTMIFCNTVSSLHELQHALEERGVQALSLHSQLHKQARLQNYQLFRDGVNRLMLSTDLGARGLDIPELERVINYDFPMSTCDYLQRAGRTGRAGSEGQVVTLYHKKNLEVINELKDASFNQPLKITNSAYGMRNREETRKRPSANR